MITRLIIYGTDEYREMISLRTRILRDPLGLIFTEEDLLKDKNGLLCGCFDTDILVGTCILSPLNNETVQLRQMAIDGNYQGKGIGNILLRFAEKTAVDNSFTKIILHARKTAVGFYLKSGYKITSDEFTEVGIPHFEMEKGLK